MNIETLKVKYEELSSLNSKKHKCIINIYEILNSEESEYNKLMQIEDLILNVLHKSNMQIEEI